MNTSIDSLMERAVSLHQRGRLADAELLYREVLRRDSRHTAALHHLGLLGMQTGHHAQAEELLASAAHNAPSDPSILNNWGIALARLGRLADARRTFERAIANGPPYSDALVNLGNLLNNAGEIKEAEACYRRAIAVSPRSAEAHNSLGKIHLSCRRLAEAVACFEEALRINPSYAAALNNLGSALRDQGQLKEALTRYRQAGRVKPDDPEAFSNLLLAMNCDPAVSPDEVFAAHLEFAVKFERPTASGPTSLSHRRPGRIRIAYVSPDFRGHAVASFVEPLLANHNRSLFEVTAYYNALAEDETTLRIRGAVERFVGVGHLTDEAFAQCVREDCIDVLIDLAGHTVGNRLLAFAMRAAPVQATWLGYLNTTGLRSMDFRITDPWTDPPGATEHWHTEQLIRLPHSLWCYRSWPGGPSVSVAPCQQNGYVTFGSTNHPAKLNAEVLAAWAKILERTPSGRIILHAPDDGGLRSFISKQLVGSGGESDRVHFVPRLPINDYLRQYCSMDIVLDTFPCAGGTTSFDALWMGTPVVALAGERPFSRGGASILGNLGLDELLVSSIEQYVDRAVLLARNPSRLADLRSHLRSKLESGPLMDAKMFASDMERALLKMCALRGLPMTDGELHP